MRCFVMILAALFLCAPLVGADAEQKIRQVLSPVVKVKSPKGSGSGVVVYSQKVDEEKSRTFILTNYHVVDDGIVKVDDKIHIALMRIEFFTYEEGGNKVEMCEELARVISIHKKVDLALLEVVEDKLIFPTAEVLPERYKLKLFDKVYAVGAGVGNNPIFTRGEINRLVGDQGGMNSPITYGFSGGGMFVERDGNFYLAGVPSQIHVWRGIHHHWIARFVKPETIRVFLEKSRAGFVLDKSQKPGTFLGFPTHDPKPVLEFFKFILPKAVPELRRF